VLKSLIERLNELQIRRPWVPLGFVALVTVVFGFFAARLELHTQFEALLPQDSPSVQELHRVQARTASAQNVLILLEGPDHMALRAMGDAIVPKLLALGPDTIGSAEDGIQEARHFLGPRAGLFLSMKELEQLRDDVDARWDYEVSKEEGTLLEDDGPPVTVEDIEKRFRKKQGGDAEDKGDKKDAKEEDRYPDGYYENKAGNALVVQARSPIPGGDLAKTGPALQKVRDVVASVQASRPEFANVRVGYAGDMVQGFLEYDRIQKDLLSVGASGIGLILASIVIYFMRVRALFVMGVTIAVGLIWTFGLTAIVIGYLNVATGFLASIVAGNGVNVGILYQARYFEERRKGVEKIQALRTAVFSTWQPTVIAAVSSAASYVSLLVTGFSAFRQFGFIAATGMIFCWIVKTLAVPPLLLILERRKPIDDSKDGKLLSRIRGFGMGYGKLFAWIVPRAPALLLALGVLLVAGGAVASVRYVQRDPLEYDMGKLGDDPGHNVEIDRVWTGVIDILGSGHGGVVLLADTPEDAKALQKKLQGVWDAAPKDDKPFAGVHSLWDMVAPDQAEKIPLLLHIGERLERARAKGYITDADWKKIEDGIPPHDLKPYGIADLPESLARAFSEKDGTRGRLAVIEPEPSKVGDVHYLFRFADTFRETRLDNGHVVRGSGNDVIFADILKAVVRDIPKAVAMSLGLTLVAVLVTFRRGGWHAASVLFALLVGVSGEMLFLYFADVKINFLNFAALPITFGIGADYAVNVAQRYRADGSKDILGALRTTGGAVVLCSLTTMLGYLALVGSLNRAIRSLGTIAVVGEVSCLLAAVLVLPALWLVVERRRAGAAARDRG
jgi:predicted RND superfamily exporter protein